MSTVRFCLWPPFFPHSNVPLRMPCRHLPVPTQRGCRFDCVSGHHSSHTRTSRYECPVDTYPCRPNAVAGSIVSLATIFPTLERPVMNALSTLTRADPTRLPVRLCLWPPFFPHSMGAPIPIYIEFEGVKPMEFGNSALHSCTFQF